MSELIAGWNRHNSPSRFFSPASVSSRTLWRDYRTTSSQPKLPLYYQHISHQHNTNPYLPTANMVSQSPQSIPDPRTWRPSPNEWFVSLPKDSISLSSLCCHTKFWRVCQQVSTSTYRSTLARQVCSCILLHGATKLRIRCVGWPQVGYSSSRPSVDKSTVVDEFWNAYIYNDQPNHWLEGRNEAWVHDFDRLDTQS